MDVTGTRLAIAPCYGTIWPELGNNFHIISTLRKLKLCWQETRSDRLLQPYQSGLYTQAAIYVPTFPSLIFQAQEEFTYVPLCPRLRFLDSDWLLSDYYLLELLWGELAFRFFSRPTRPCYWFSIFISCGNQSFFFFFSALRSLLTYGSAPTRGLYADTWCFFIGQR